MFMVGLNKIIFRLEEQNMKRIKLLSYMFLIIGICASCGLIGEQQYTCDVENIKSIQIVSLDDYVEGEYRYDYTVLCEIPDEESFVKELLDVECRVNWGEPLQLREGYVAIRIEYINGDYDLLHSEAQWKNREGVNNYGFFFFDKTEFDNLIDEWMRN